MTHFLPCFNLIRPLKKIAFRIVLVIGFYSAVFLPEAAYAAPEKPQLTTISSTPDIKKEASGANILATVNGYAITQAEFDAVSAFPLANIKDDRLRYQAKSKLLRDLIDEYLIEQKIKESKLDQDPIFQPLMEREKRNSALNTYQVYIAARSPVNLTSADIDSFIRTNKQYFAERKTYRLIQFILPPQVKIGTEVSVELVRNFTSKFNQAQFTSWLIDQEVEFQRSTLWQGSEQISPQLLSKLSTMKAGSVLVEGIAPLAGSSSAPDTKTDGIRVIYFIDSYPDPINADEARNSIARNLFTLASRSKINETMQDLRAKANIVILDENLKLDVTNLNQVDSLQAAERKSARRLEYVRTAWFFFLICLVPLTLWRFFKTVPKISEKEGSLKTLQTLEQTSVMRFIETLLFSLLLFFPLWRFVLERLQYYDYKVMILSGVCGVAVSFVLMFVVVKTPFLKDLNKHRFFAVTLLLLVQYLVMAI